MNDQFKIRRRIAISSFLVVVSLVPTLLFMAIKLDPDQAPVMNAVMPILVIVIPALVANISHYMHQVQKSDDA